jgi:hypothetical protein
MLRQRLRLTEILTEQELARLTFVREARRRGLAFQGDTEAVETVPIPPVDPSRLSWEQKARGYGVEGLPRRWWSGEFYLGRPIPNEAYFTAVKRMYGLGAGR